MASRKKAGGSKNVGGKAPATAPKVSGPAAKSATLAHVYLGKEHIRTYSKAEHGAEFLDYAKEFASKVEGRRVETE